MQHHLGPLGYLTDVGTLLGWCLRDGVGGEKFLKAMLFAAGILFFGLGGVAAKELHASYGMQVGFPTTGKTGDDKIWDSEVFFFFFFDLI